MKTIYKNTMLLLVVLCGTLVSCDKEFLDKNPTDAISSQTFWQNEKDVAMGLAGVYRRLRDGFYGNRKLWLDTYSDNALDRHSFYGFGSLTQGIVNSTNVTSNFYNSPYAGIASCNFFLENADQTPIDESTLTKYKAEVRFLRSMFYFDLVQAFGDVVLYKTAPTSIEESKVKQSPKAEVLAFIHEDLDFAITNLPNDTYNGHAVKGSAQALKARVLLFQQKWDEAASMAQQVMMDGPFEIYQGGYQNLFLTQTQQQNPEIIFSTKFLSPDNYHVGEGIEVELGWYGSIQPYQNLVDDYETIDGKEITDPTSMFDPANPFLNRDPRLRMTVKVPIDPYINPDGSIFSETDPLLTGGYSQKKYVELARLPFGRGKINLSDQNIVHIRYADVLLMYAEAKNEATGPDATIYSALNEIRSRVGVNMPNVDEGKYNTQETLRDYIRHERRIELALEGFRYHDLKRWNMAQEKLSTVTNPGGVQLSFGETNNVLPFSLNELDKNPELDQKEGY